MNIRAAVAPAAGVLALQRLRDRLSGRADTSLALRGAFLAFGIRIAGAALAFISQALIARWMGADGFGIYAYAWVLVILVGTLAQAGFSVSIVRLVSEYRARARLRRLAGALRFSAAFVLMLSSAVALCGMALVDSFSGRLGPLYREPLLIAMATVPFFALSELGKGIARAHDRTAAAYMPGFIVRPLLLLASLAALWSLGAPLTPSAVLWAVLGSTLAALVLQWAQITGNFRATLKPRVSFAHRWQWVRMSLPFMVIDGYFLMMAHFDVVMLNSFAQPAEVAIYFASSKTAALLAFIFFAISAVAAAPLARLHAAGRTDELRQAAGNFIAWMFWPSLLGAGGLAVLGPSILSIFGPEFVAGYPTLMLLVAGLLVQAATGPLKFLVGMTGGQTTMAAILTVGLALNVAFNLVLIPLFGPLGAALATLASTIAATAALAILVRRRLGFWPIVGMTAQRRI